MAGLRYTFTENKAYIHQLLNENNQAQMNDIINNIRETSKLTDEYIKQYESVGFTGKKKEDLENFKKMIQDYARSRDKVIDAVTQGDYETSYKIGESEYKVKRDKILEGINNKVAQANKDSQELKEKNEKTYHSSKTVMNLVMGIGFLGSLALGIVLSQHLIKRIRRIKELTERIEERRFYSNCFR